MCRRLSKLKPNTLFSVRVPRRLLSAPMSRRGYSQTISLIGVIASSVLPDDVEYGRRREGDTDTGLQAGLIRRLQSLSTSMLIGSLSDISRYQGSSGSHEQHQVSIPTFLSNSTMSFIPILKVNSNRLHETLHHSCQWGSYHPLCTD